MKKLFLRVYLENCFCGSPACAGVGTSYESFGAVSVSLKPLTQISPLFPPFSASEQRTTDRDHNPVLGKAVF